MIRRRSKKRGRERERRVKGKRLVAGISRWMILGWASLVKLALCASVTGPLSLQADLHPTISFFLCSVCLLVTQQLQVVFLMYCYLSCLSSDKQSKLTHLIYCPITLLYLGTVRLVPSRRRRSFLSVCSQGSLKHPSLVVYTYYICT